jgi:hypothetical protein
MKELIVWTIAVVVLVVLVIGILNGYGVLIAQRI